MPSIVTHHIFAKDIEEKLKLNVNNNYYIFAQSHDYLYYSFNKNNRRLAHIAHTKNTQKYILNIIKYIKENNQMNNINTLSYLYGTITHYVLDSTIHPYLFYKNGLKTSNHREIERNIDKLFYEQKYSLPFNKLKISKTIIVNPLFTRNLMNCINYAYEETYNMKNISKAYLKSIKDARLLFNLTSYDKFGLKLSIYRLIDHIFKTKLYCLSNHIEGNELFLNNNKKKWIHPCIKTKTYKSSFNDLYDESIKKCTKIINNVNKYFESKITFNELLKTIPNISYTTGLLLEENKRMINFE